VIVCHCGVVSDRDVVDTISAGARTTAEVCRSTGAGRSCGTCIFSVRQLLRQHASSTAGEAAVDGALGPRPQWTAALDTGLDTALDSAVEQVRCAAS